jgi:hypothetical protein
MVRHHMNVTPVTIIYKPRLKILTGTGLSRACRVFQLQVVHIGHECKRGIMGHPRRYLRDPAGARIRPMKVDTH